MNQNNKLRSRNTTLMWLNTSKVTHARVDSVSPWLFDVRVYKSVSCIGSLWITKIGGVNHHTFLSCVFLLYVLAFSGAYQRLGVGGVRRLAALWLAIRPCAGSYLSCCPVVPCVTCLYCWYLYVGVGFVLVQPRLRWTVFYGLVGMSGGSAFRNIGQNDIYSLQCLISLAFSHLQLRNTLDGSLA